MAMLTLIGFGVSCGQAEPKAEQQPEASPNVEAAQPEDPPKVEPAEPETAAVPATVQALLDERGACLELPGSVSIVEPEGKSRVQFRGVPSEGGFELAYSLGAVEADTSATEGLAGRMMHVFMYNFAADDQIGPPTTLSEEIAKAHGADLAIRACFTPGPSLGDGKFGHGVAYGLFKRNVGSTLLLMVSEDAEACAQPPDLERFGFSYCR